MRKTTAQRGEELFSDLLIANSTNGEQNLGLDLLVPALAIGHL
jgi:hypothetical protein